MDLLPIEEMSGRPVSAAYCRCDTNPAPALAADESPRNGHPLEWWYVTGRFHAAGQPASHFMIAVFRSEAPAGRAHAGDGLELLVCHYDGTTRQYQSTVCVNPTMVAMAAAHDPHRRPVNLDQRFLRAYQAELAQERLPAPVELWTEAGTCDGSPLAIAWGDFELRQVGGGFHLRFRGPGAQVCEFQLDLLAPPMDIAPSRHLGHAQEKMSCTTYPRLALRGEADGIPVSGTAWLDHQCGGHAWLTSSDAAERLLGWDWLGINLDDGSSLVVLVHRDAATRDIIARHATRAQADGTVLSCGDIELRPLRTWRSPRTRIEYPVSWQIDLPAWETTLTFTPLCDDQEARVFGYGRAIWEGAGTVLGTSAGRTVAGMATAEAYGYGFVFNLHDYLAAAAAPVDRHLESLLPRRADESSFTTLAGPAAWRHEPAAYNAVIARPVWDLLDRSGKRWRPVFASLLLEALGRDPLPFEQLVSVLAELPHTGALMIDDIQDDSRLRRGQECIHRIYGVDLTINAGNAIYFLPMLPIRSHPDLTAEEKLEIHDVLSHQFARGHFGQGLDLYWSRTVDEEHLERWLTDDLIPKILEMYSLKTSSVLEGLASVAALIARRDSAARSACERFARNLGVAFQIADDIHNFSTSPKWRKVCGEDLAQGKLTYVTVQALLNLEPQYAARLRHILCTPARRADGDTLAEGIDLIRNSGALEISRDHARDLLHAGWQDLAPHLASSEPKILLQALSEHLVDLDLES